MKSHVFFGVVRTDRSEQYLIWDGDIRVGHLHLHYSYDIVYMTLALEIDMTKEEKDDLVDEIDDTIISSAIPPYDRHALNVTILRASNADTYTIGNAGD